MKLSELDRLVLPRIAIAFSILLLVTLLALSSLLFRRFTIPVNGNEKPVSSLLPK